MQGAAGRHLADEGGVRLQRGLQRPGRRRLLVSRCDACSTKFEGISKGN